MGARGLDIHGLTLVVNYDVPDMTLYLFRLGHVGRYGRKGECIILVTDDEAFNLKGVIQVMRRTKQSVPKSIEHVSRHIGQVIHDADVIKTKNKYTVKEP